jgi:TP901 family phage tail tape measure protein
VAVQLGQAYIAIHADGAALAGEIRAQMETALAEASAMGGAAGAEAGAGMAGTTVAAEEASAAIAGIGSAATVAGSEVDAATGRMVAGAEAAAAGMESIGAASTVAAEETVAAADAGIAATGRLTAATDAARGSSGLLGMSWKTMGELAAGVGIYEAIKAAGNFQQQLTRLVTSANETTGNLGIVRQGMLDLGGQVGFSANELSKGMYIVESAGYHGRDGLLAVKAAAEIAKQENADLATTTQAVTTTMRDYGYGAGDAATVASKLNEAVAFGKTNLQDFSAALHSVEPNAAAAHIKLEDVLGALSTMTNSGMSAQQAAQNLSHTLSNFENPSQPMINALSQIGLNANDLKANLSTTGLTGTILEVSDAIRKQMGPAGDVAVNALNQNKTAAQALVTEMSAMPDNLAQLSQSLLTGETSIKDYRSSVRDMGGEAGAMGMQFLSLYQSSDGFNSILKQGGPSVQTYIGMLAKSTGTVDALRTALLLASDGGDKVNTAIKGISDVSAQADGNVSKWVLTQKTFNQRFDEAKASVENFGVSLGQKLLPVLSDVASWVTTTVVPALSKAFDWFGKLATSGGVVAAWKTLKDVGGVVISVLGAVIGVVATLVGWFEKLPDGVQGVVLAFAALRIVLATDFFGLFSRAAAGAAANTAAVAAAAGPAAVEVGTLGAAAAEAGGTVEGAAVKTGILGDGLTVLAGKAKATAGIVVSSMAEVKAAYMEAAAVGGFEAEIAGAGVFEQRISMMATGATGALKNLAQQGFGAAKGAASGLYSALGGGVGMAMIGGMVGLTLYNEGTDEATRISKSAGQAGADLAATYVKLGDVYGQSATYARDNVRASQDLKDVAYQAGVSQDTMTLALQGNAKAQQEVIDKTDSLHNRWFALGHDLNSGNFGAIFSGNFMTNNTDKMQALFDSLNAGDTQVKQFNQEVDKTPGTLADIRKAMIDVYGPANVMTLNITGLSSAMRDLHRAGGDVQKETDGLNAVWANLGQNAGGTAGAMAATTEAVDAIGHAFDNVSTEAFDAKGNIDLTSKAGADLFGSLQQIATAGQGAANAAFLAAGGNNNLAEASKAAGDSMDKSYQAFMASATAAGMGQQAAAELAAQLHLVPGSVATAILQPGMTEAQAGISILQGQTTTLVSRNPYTVTLKSITADAEAALDATGYHVTHMPDGTVQVTANTGPAESALSSWLRINAYHEVMVVAKAHIQVSYTGEGINVGNVVGKGNALGAVLTPMADGGFFNSLDNRLAQIVPPQTYRLVGDRMQGDEAYIPLDGTPRSKALWAEAGRRMGLGGGGGPVMVTYAPQYTLPPTADPSQVAAMVGANTARDFQLGMESLSSLGWATN